MTELKTKPQPPTLELTWSTGEDFMEGVQRTGRVASFFYALPEGREFPPAFRPCAVLSVMLGFEDREMTFHAHVQVVGHKREGHRRGVWLEFLPSERGRQELVLACAEGESIPYHRRWADRLSCALPVRVGLESGLPQRATATNISRGGLHLTDLDGLALEQRLTLEVKFNLDRALRVGGRVAYVLTEGPQKGAGVEFLFASLEQRSELIAEVARLEGLDHRERGVGPSDRTQGLAGRGGRQCRE